MAKLMYDDQVTALRLRLRAMRQRQNLTAATIAHRMGISRPFFTQLEGGTRRLSVNYLLAWCDAMHTPPFVVVQGLGGEGGADAA